MDYRELLEHLIVSLRLWEEEQRDDIVLPEVVDQVEAMVFGEVPQVELTAKEIKKRREAGKRTTQLSTLRQWWLNPSGPERIEDWLSDHSVTYLKKFCRQEGITVHGHITRNLICGAIRSAVQGPAIPTGKFYVRKRRRRTGGKN